MRGGTTRQSTAVLYTGVTSDLLKRIYEHKNKITWWFTSRYNCSQLVYYEVFGDPENAILREKQLKVGSRDKKVELINSMNPTWKDLYADIVA